MREQVLIIGPHPDDAFIGCGGYILNEISGVDADVLCLCYKNMTPTSEHRIEEEIGAWVQVEKMSKSNITLHFYEEGYDTQLYKNRDNLIKYLEHFAEQKEYDKIFFPFHDDTHQDHREASQCAMSALRYQKNLFYYETPSTLNFQPSIFLELNEERAAAKIEIARIYDSQIFGDDEKYQISLSDYVETRMLATGLKSRMCKYAEGYKPYRTFINEL